MAMAQPKQGSGLQLGRIFGIPIYVHLSWLIIFVLITLSLVTQFNPQHTHWTQAQHWVLGIVVSLLFFASIVFHELSHSVISMHYKIPVRSITLFVFGGLASIERDPDNALQEFNIAIAGPISSLFLGGCFWVVARFSGSHAMIAAGATWLCWINVALALFNLVPGFPLDGGRVLRGIAWGITKDFTRATRIASNAGRFFAYVMIFVGIWQALTGNLVGGIWLAFIGWFLLEAAKESFTQVVVRNTLAGVRAMDIMTRDVASVARDVSLEEYVQEVLKTGRRCHIVTGAGTPVGLITLHAARAVPREEWANTSIQAVMLPIARIHWASPEEPALSVLQRMQAEDVNQMPVVSEGNIIGMIGRDTVLRALQSRLAPGQLAHQ